MTVARIGSAASLLLLLLLTPLSEVRAEAESDAADLSGVEGAYGTIVDSVTVTGNKRTKTYVILREMQTQPGQVLDQKTIRRDIRFISDLSPFAEVEVRADSIAPGRTALRIRVEERSGLFLKSILPFVKYNFESGLTYGVRWKDKNFRGRLEQLTVSYSRNQQEDDDASVSWSSPWLGWRHISLGGQVRYFNRGEMPPRLQVLENLGVSGFVALPLTESRIRFAQAEASLSFDRSRNGGLNLEQTKQLIVSPQIGFRFDSRDSRLRPEAGWTFYAGVGQSIPVHDGGGAYYRLHNEVRTFFSLSEKNVIALQSNLFYQFGEFPEYSRIGLGGARSLRGYADDRLRGRHRWFGTLEWRHLYLPRKVFQMPLVKQFDVGLAFVSFLDSGITWDGSSDFDFDRFHGTAGLGIRFYSPLRDVVRFDFGFSAQGEARFHTGTGIRF